MTIQEAHFADWTISRHDCTCSDVIVGRPENTPRASMLARVPTAVVKMARVPTAVAKVAGVPTADAKLADD